MLTSTIFLLAILFCYVSGDHHVGLGKTCSTDVDCAAAYSRCSEQRICACINGFDTDWSSGLCEPNSYACPTNDPEQLHYSNKMCVVKNSDFGDKDNCSAGEYCFLLPYTKTPTGSDVGSCCPLLATTPRRRVYMTCPLGGAGAVLRGKCPDTSDLMADSTAPLEKIRTCSYLDAECVWYRKASICCPRPCVGSSSHFNIEGKCFDYAAIGENCSYDAQCTGRSFCLPIHNNSSLKTCQCKTRLLLNHAPQYCEEEA
uniref:EB domain-containing protein n=1 Tax=Romanomermis culicivorax TaxID=13658 RepID=A0A915JHI1_ROMCU